MKKFLRFIIFIPAVILGFFAVYNNSFAAPASVQSTSTIPIGAGSTLSKNFATGTMMGNLIVVWTAWGNGAGSPACADNKGNVYLTTTVIHDTLNIESAGICG